MTSVYEQEIEELHDFFVAWFLGELPRNEASFARFTSATAPDFTLISPNGHMQDQESLVDWIENAHNSRTHFKIWIDNFQLHQVQDGIAIVTYEEWGETVTGITSRLSTAIFADHDAAPNGVRWLHVHETWLTKNA